MSSITLEMLPFNKTLSVLKRLQLATKNLKFQVIKKGEDKRKLVVSTQILAQMGWLAGQHLKEVVVGRGLGLSIRRTFLGEKRDKLVYQREYKKTKRFETLLDIRDQSKINEAFLGAHEAHIKIMKDEILITPVFRSGDFDTHGAIITIPSLSQHRDAIVSVLETMRAHNVNHAELIFDDLFAQSHDFLLLQTQLRRDGFEMEITSSGMRVYIKGHQFAIKTPLDLDEPRASQAPPSVSNLDTFVGMSGGVDGHLLELENFNCTHVLEYRPNEARDKTDKTEKNALALVMNTSSTHLFNEDIYRANHEMIGELSKNISHAHFSLSCPDFSTLKTRAAKKKSFETLTTSRDMFIPLLALIDHQRPLTLSVENVPNFASSPECEIFTARLKRMGYNVTSYILDATVYRGHTKRKRLYLFASLFSHELKLEEPSTSELSAWDVVKKIGIDVTRDVTENKTVQDGIKCGRIRLLTPDTMHAPTIFRSQSRGVKDALYINFDGRYYMPTLTHLRGLMGIPDSFQMDFLNSELQTEIIGNSVDAEMHTVWVRAIKNHLLAVMNSFSPGTISMNHEHNQLGFPF